MTTVAPELTITRVPVPPHLDAPEARELLALMDVFNTAVEHDLGMDHLRWEAAEELPLWQDQTYRHLRGFVAHRRGRAVGALQVTAPTEPGARELEFDLLVLPEERGAGVEDALLEVLLGQARELGRDRVQTYTLHRADAPGAPIASPTGFGAISADVHTDLFARHGFRLLQVERNSTFDLTGDLSPVRVMLADAEAAAGADYRLVCWTAPTPQHHQAGFAYVLSRMATDVPTGGMTFTEEHWDAARVARRDARMQASGLTVSVAAVEHVPSGTLVAYNELSIGADRSRPTHQYGTLVLKEHRGHRLGTIVKCANILRWRELVPTSPMITTFNAEENRPMLDVNEAVGFRPLTYAGAWQLDLSAAG